MIEMFLTLSLQKRTGPGAGFAQTTFTGAFSVPPQSIPSEVYALVMKQVIPAEWHGSTVLFYSAVPNTPIGGAL